MKSSIIYDVLYINVNNFSKLEDRTLIVDM